MTTGRTGWLRRIGADVVDIYRRGGRALVAAPVLVAIAVLPEAAQHVAEIRLGMFGSRDAFRALADDPTRWAFGYAKVAGFVIAILAIARFWVSGSVRRALLPSPGTLLRVVVWVAASFALGWPFSWLQARIDAPAADLALGAVSLVIQTGLLLVIVAALLEDRTATVREAFTRRFPTALLLTLYAALAFGPAQAMHMANHRLALGRPDAVVWALMAFDALWVGLLAALVGSALFVGGRARLTWRGWDA